MRIEYLKYISCSGLITSVREERELICMQLLTCKYVVSVWRSFLYSGYLGWAAHFIVALHGPSI